MEFKLVAHYLQNVHWMDVMNLVSVYEIPEFKLGDKEVVGIRVHPLRRFRVPDDLWTVQQES